jgi:hypothetical protein
MLQDASSLNNSRQSDRVVPIGAGRTNFRAEIDRSIWAISIQDRLEKLVGLPVGWDGYTAGPVSFSTAQFAWSALTKLCSAGSPVPQIVPGVDGDLQVEWHEYAGSVEIHFRAPYDAHIVRQLPGMEQEESEISDDFTLAFEWVKSVVEAPIAAVAAAG